MNDQEREVIADIFSRLEQASGQPRDPEAERFIADKISAQPYAPYAMAQALYVQEQALGRLHGEIERLRAELDQARQQPQQGGFLSGLFGGGSRPSVPPYPARAVSPWGDPNAQPLPPSYGPSYGMPQAGMTGGPWSGMQPSGGGFLQGALSTAAGVAGGMMIANALSHAFGGSQGHQGFLDSGAAGLGGFANQPSSDPGGMAGITDSLYQGSRDDQPGHDDLTDFGGDNGDGGDWT